MNPCQYYLFLHLYSDSDHGYLKPFQCMPELELDTVFEAGELSTGDVIDSGSSNASSNKNNNLGVEIISSMPNLSNKSRPHQLQNEVATSNATFSTLGTAKNKNSNLLVVPNSIPLNNKVTTVIHEPPSGFVESPVKCNSYSLSGQEKISKSETLSDSTASKSSYAISNEMMIISSDTKIATIKDATDTKNRFNENWALNFM